ncbi:MAG: TMEM175 family protein [Candidatus Eremiobacteraeota bacterium]|nr:TMEM175 family protein [Candidatus Eremiobacteraeota bacterium]
MLSTDGADFGDKHLLSRLLGFSDIVMGFSMALLGLSLHPPDSLLKMGEHIPELGVFLVGFALMAFLWWFQHRLFACYFVANSLSIVLNFAMLAGVVVFVYVIESFTLLFRTPVFDMRSYVIGVSLWCASYGVVMALMGAMYAIGVRKRWKSLRRDLQIWGVERAVNAGAGGLLLIVVAFIAPHVPPIFVGFLGALMALPLLVQKLVVRRI